jgi:hypothetical protein
MRVMLVTRGNPPLEDALQRLPGVRLTVVTPDRYPQAGEHDTAVFDRFLPAEPPPTGALLLRPPAHIWLPGQHKVSVRPRVTGWDESHPVTVAVQWNKLRLARAMLSRLPETTSGTLVSAHGSGANGSVEGALVTTGFSQARWVHVGFALEDSNFPLQPDFPVFLGNALKWVSESVPVLTRGLGSVEVELPGARVHDGNGNVIASSATARGIVFEAPGPDVFTVSSPDGQVLVVANVADRRYAQINRSRFDEGSATANQRDEAPPGWKTEVWVILLLLGGAFLLFEWAVFTRPRVV